MKVYDVLRIVKKTQGKQPFSAFFSKYIRQEDVQIETAFDVLRISGCYFNRRSLQPANEFNTGFMCMIQEMLDVWPGEKPQIEAFKTQCEMMHTINNAFFSSLEKNNIWHSGGSKSASFNAKFIIFSEIYLSCVSAMIAGKDLNEIKKCFPFFVISASFITAENSFMKVVKDFPRAYDEIVFYTGKVFSQLNLSVPLKLNAHLDRDELPGFIKYLNQWNQFDSLSRISDFFRLSRATLVKIKENEYSIEVTDECLYFDFEVARNRLLMRAINLSEEVKRTFKENDSIIDIVPSYLTKDNIFDAIQLSELENMAPEDMHEEYGGVSLYNWVYAYQSLVALSSEAMKKRLSLKKKIPLDADSWLIIKTRAGWSNFFQKKGLSQKSARLLIEYLTFNNQSQDINDCPFIRCENGLCLMPALVFRSSVTRSLMSLFSSKKIVLTSKGRFHEEQFIRLAKNAGVDARSIALHNNFECDCLMLIDNHLIFTELKSNGQPVHYGKYYQSVCNIIGDASSIKDDKNKKMRAYTEQIERYTNHYLQHLDVIIKEFGLPNSWRPEGVHKLIVTTTLLGGIYHTEDCFIADKFSLATFFARAPGRVHHYSSDAKIQKIQQKGYEFCEGEITIGNFLGYLKTLPGISFTRKNINKMTYDVNFSEVKVNFPYYDSWPGEPFIRFDDVESLQERE